VCLRASYQAERFIALLRSEEAALRFNVFSLSPPRGGTGSLARGFSDGALLG